MLFAEFILQLNKFSHEFAKNANPEIQPVNSCLSFCSIRDASVSFGPLLPATLSHHFKIMKTLQLLLIGMCMWVFQGSAQNPKPRITVLNIDTKGINMTPDQMGNLVRMELEKLDIYGVTDRYDAKYLIEKNNLKIEDCYGKLCLLEIGKIIESDFVYTGSVELYGQTLIVTMRLINVKSGHIEKTQVNEFLNLPLEVQQMIGITIRNMHGFKNNEDLVMRLTKKYDFDNSINNPNKTQLSLTGPRFGYAFMFGKNANRLSESATTGGFDIYPRMFQFGYQFEKQYLNEGNYQALFEFIPMVSGVDQQMIIPNFLFLNGFRDNKRGWEIAIGPSFGFNKYSDLCYYEGRYYTAFEMRQKGITKFTLEKTLDKNGDPSFSSALIVAFGKTFKSGKMNIPVNVWASIPTKDGFSLGISIGYNSKK